jgi:peptide/nickel transport system ATP-binding protein
MLESTVRAKSMEPIIRSDNVSKVFGTTSGFFGKTNNTTLHAVRNISLEINPNETLGLVGESGSGKSTFGKIMAGLMQPSSGEIVFLGKKLDFKKKLDYETRIRMQMIFQDSLSSFNPRKSVFHAVSLPLKVAGKMNKEEIRHASAKALEDVGLSPAEEFLFRYPHELSGGQRQRVSIARSLILNPNFVVADEPVSSLDVSVKAQILKLLQDIKRKKGVSVLFISHDIAAVRLTSDQVAVIYKGTIVEVARKDDLFREPLHPYTQLLMESEPIPDPDIRKLEQQKVKRNLSDTLALPASGCIFLARCPYAMEKCTNSEPQLLEKKPSHKVACYLN